MGGGVGIWVKLYPRMLIYLFIFSYFSASTAYPEKRGLHPKTCLVFPLGRFAQGVKTSSLPPKPFFNGPNKAIIVHGSE